MTRSSFLFFLLFVSAQAELYSQSVKWSAQLDNDKRMPFLKILGPGENGYFVLRSNISFNDDRNSSGFKSRKYELHYYSKDLALRWVQSLTPTCENCHVADVALSGSDVVVLYSQFDKKQKLFQLFVQKIDEEGRPEGERKQLLEITVEKVDDENQPDLVVSHNQNFLACAFHTVPRGKETQLYSIIVFDSTLAISYKKEFNIPVPLKRFSPLNSILTDAGNFFLLGVEYTTDKKIKNPGESFYKLYSYNSKSNVAAINEIKLGDKFLTDVGISADNLNHKMVVAGFYSDKTTYSTAGVFYYSLTEDSLKETPVVTSSFTPEFLRKFAGERRENNNKELTDYSIDRVVLRKDGGAAIMAESFYTSTQSYWDYYMQMWVNHYYYHFGNIISFSINPGGTLLWSNVITKDQSSTDDGGYYSSYYSAIINGRIYTIYNKYLTNPGSVLVTSISGAGVTDTKTLFRESENVTVVPHSAKQIDESSILVSALRDDKAFLAKISF